MQHKAFKSTAVALFLGATTLSAFAQNRTITGKVVDTQGESVPGATITVVGDQKIGTTTDVDGNFSLSVPVGAKITVQFVGYDRKTITVGEKTDYEVTLAEDVRMLEESVVIGYGVQKKSDLTGSVSSVKASDIQHLATTDAAAALQGKAAGVQILNYSGAPGQGATIRVRGYSSNSDKTGPLLIVDGLHVDNIQYLDPSMIESMEILKDAASAAIYGAQAGNGVVLITTKTGKSRNGKSSVTFESKFMNQSLGKKPKIFGAEDWIKYKRMSGLPIDDMLQQNNYDGTDTDWFDVVFGNSLQHQQSLTFQGSTEKSNFFTSVNILDNDGIVKGDKDVYKRLSAQINADYQLYKWLKVGTNTSIEKWETRSVPHMSQYNSVMNSAMTLDPLTPVYYSDPSQMANTMRQAYNEGQNILKDPSNGLWYATSKYMTDDSGNPLLQRDRVDSKNSGTSVRGTLYANLTPFKGFTFTSRFGYRISHSNSHSFDTPYYATPQAQSKDYHISAAANTGHYYMWENFANYNILLGEKHDLTAMAGMSYTENNWDNVSGSGQGPDILKGYESNFRYLDFLNGNDDTAKGVGNAPGKNTQIAYFGRLVYSYDNRYSVQANFRADAFDSSKLSKNKRWGYFPSFSGGWTISNEKFIKDNIGENVLSFLKVRASWGRNGNIAVLQNYPYATTINYNGSWYQYGVNAGTATYGSKPSGLANPNLKWETSEQTDLGLDARFLDNRLTLGFDYFDKRTKDLLVTITPVYEVGVSSSVINGGSVKNQGIELQLGWQDNIGDFTYSINTNMSWLKNRVTSLATERLTGTEGGVQGTNNKVNSYFEKGAPVWYFHAYKYLGVNQETGEAIIQDTNKDGAVTPEDMTNIGNAIPDVLYGITLQCAWKGLDLNIFGTGQAGNDIFTLFYRSDTPMRNSLRYYYENAWTTENRNASMPDPARVANDNVFWSSSASMFSGAFFKIKQIQLGYTLPRKITRKAMIDNLRLYVSLDDFFTITKYPGCDPETATTNLSASQMGYDNGTYPTAKKFTWGLSLTF